MWGSGATSAIWPPKKLHVPRRACGSNDHRGACYRYPIPIHELCTYRFSSFCLDRMQSEFIPRRKAFEISCSWHQIGMHGAGLGMRGVKLYAFAGLGRPFSSSSSPSSEKMVSLDTFVIEMTISAARAIARYIIPIQLDLGV